MKKLILSLLILTMLTGCVSKPVKQEEVTTTVSEETVTEEKTDFSGKTASDISDTNNIQVQQYETSILRDRIADIV